MADRIKREEFETAFNPLYSSDKGSLGKPIRLLVGLLMLKHIRNVSDEGVVAQWSENNYYQYFCGETSFISETPCEASELAHFRKRIGEKGIELILKESIRINGLDREETQVNIDTTVQEKNITYPTDAKLHKKIIKKSKAIERAKEDRRYRGKKQIGETHILIPTPPKKSWSYYQRKKVRATHRKRAAIEPIIGHIKSDYRLNRNFYKGVVGENINIMLAAGVFNFKRMMNKIKSSFYVLLNKVIYSCFSLLKIQNSTNLAF